MSCLRVMLLVLLLAGVAKARADDAARDDEMVCVPASDGRSWECGTRANPPPERGLGDVPRGTRGAAPPPPFLAAAGARSAAGESSAPPARSESPPPRDTLAPAPERGAAPVAEALPEPTSAPALAERPAAVPAPPPMLAAPRQRVAPYAPLARPAPADAPIAAAPAPAPALAPAADPQPAAPPEPLRARAQPAPVAVQAAAPAPPAVPSRTMALRDSAAFLRLEPNRFTLQLARTASRADAQLLAAQLGLDSDDAALFALPVEIAGSTQWLVLWSHFADAAAARAAWQAASTTGARPAAYPRRIGPLQAEARR